MSLPDRFFIRTNLVISRRDGNDDKYYPGGEGQGVTYPSVGGGPGRNPMQTFIWHILVQWYCASRSMSFLKVWEQ